MFTQLLQVFLKYARMRVEGVLTEIVTPIGSYVKGVVIGTVCLLLATICFGLTLCILTMVLWFALASHMEWAVAGLWTGLGTIVLGGILATVGVVRFKKLPSEPASR